MKVERNQNRKQTGHHILVLAYMSNDSTPACRCWFLDSNSESQERKHTTWSLNQALEDV